MRRFKSLLLTAICCTSLSAQPPVLANRYDRFTTGANTLEKILTIDNVTPKGFGKLYSHYIDGAAFAQPLYVPAVPIVGKGTHDVVYVATMNDKIYAFNAAHAGPPLWLRDLTDELAGITPVPVADITNRNDLNVVGMLGIEGTPVIDLPSNAMFFVARTKENGTYVQRLHKIDIRSGKDLAAPVVIQASVPGKALPSGQIAFDPKAGHQRAALVMVDGKVVVAWASHEDIQPYHGWVMAYDAATLQQNAAWCVTPDGPEGGIWQSGRGPAVGEDGGIYFEIGNGHWDGERNFGTSVVKLKLSKSGFTVADFYTPHDFEALNAKDADLGSTGPMLIPGTNLLLCGNKKGTLMLLDKDHLGKFTPEDKGILQGVDVRGGRDLAGPAFWDGPAGPSVYIWTEADFLKGFRLQNSRLDEAPFAHGNVGSKGSPGGALTVSSNGKQPRTGIVWGMLTVNKSADHGNAPGVICAYNAETLEELWNSEANAARDRLGTLVKFVPPLVVAGRVYAPNFDNALVVYGILP